MIFLVLLLSLLFVSGLVFELFFSVKSQLFGYFPYQVPTADKRIALSFDDGPNGRYTEQIADVLAAHNVPATFFQVGTNIDRHPATTKRLAAEGHIIGNHLYYHRFRTYFSRRRWQQELSDNQKRIHQLIGQTPALYRPPWLFRTPGMLAYVTKQHLTPISGRFGNQQEIFQPSAHRIADSAYKTARPGTILIFHDGYNARGGDRAQTTEAIDLLIPRLKRDGYRFVTVAQLLNIKPYQPTTVTAP